MERKDFLVIKEHHARVISDMMKNNCSCSGMCCDDCPFSQRNTKKFRCNKTKSSFTKKKFKAMMLEFIDTFGLNEVFETYNKNDMEKIYESIHRDYVKQKTNHNVKVYVDNTLIFENTSINLMNIFKEFRREDTYGNEFKNKKYEKFVGKELKIINVETNEVLDTFGIGF